MKKFEDLVFIPWYTGTRASMTFPNGYGISVLCGTDWYSNGVNLFEVAVLGRDGKVDLTTPIADDVLPWRTAEQVTEIMSKIQAL